MFMKFLGMLINRNIKETNDYVARRISHNRYLYCFVGFLCPCMLLLSAILLVNVVPGFYTYFLVSYTAASFF